MVQIIAGIKGKGKTKRLLDMANTAVKDARGSVVYLDKSSKHMYELSNKIRLINVSEFNIMTSDGFIGFVSGIISQDHDLEKLYLDGFLDCAKLTADTAADTIEQLNAIGELYGIDIHISFSASASSLPEDLKKKVMIEV